MNLGVHRLVAQLLRRDGMSVQHGPLEELAVRFLVHPFGRCTDLFVLQVVRVDRRA